MHEKLYNMKKELSGLLRSDRLLRSAVKEVNKIDIDVYKRQVLGHMQLTLIFLGASSMAATLVIPTTDILLMI